MRPPYAGLLPLALVLLSHGARTQSIAPDATTSTGGHGAGSSAMLSWSLGQVCGASLTGGAHIITAGVQQPEVPWVRLGARVFLGGPFNAPTTLMNDGLRSLSLIPNTEPYTSAGFAQHGEGGGEQAGAGVFTLSGSNAIVDWVFVELRSAATPTQVVSTRCAFVQRDGDVVDTDGSSALRLSAIPGNYHVAIRHRNHLPVMTLAPVALSSAPVTVNFTSAALTTYGTSAQRVDGGVFQLWPGDVTVNHQVKYTGPSNDRDPILVAVGSTTPNNTLNGQYSTRDVNLDGSVKYTGSGNDRDLILIQVGSTTPNNVRSAQLP